MIFDRLAGLETEYAVRHRFGTAAPIVERLIEEIGALTPTASNNTLMWLTRTFCANGGAFYHEVQSSEEGEGLLEGATPECRGPAQLLTYQRAQERLLLAALAELQDHSIGLVKNSRDAVGNTFGVQENYEAVVATGWRLTAYRAGLLLLTPLFAVGWVVSWLLFLLLLLSIVPWLMVAIVEGLTDLNLGTERVFRWLAGMAPAIDRVLCRVVFGLPLLGLFLLLRLFAFVEFRRDATAYLISRAVVTGTGTLEPNGDFHISERKSAIAGLTPMHLGNDGVFVFWFSNFAKRAITPAFFQFRYYRTLFAERQRLQIALSDSNACEEAEYLKIGTAMLMLDMAEAGALRGAPVIAEPMRAMATIGGVPHLEVTVETNHGPLTALEIQRFYCERARRFLREQAAVSLDAQDVVNRWADVLDALETDPETLVGRIDWVTKRYLLETAGANIGDAARKKIDVRYHELGTGYLAQMADDGFVDRVTSYEAVTEAMFEAPAGSPARLRSRYVRGSTSRTRIDWREVRIKHGWFDTEVIRLDDYR